jgi:hypothetical protein
MRFPRPSALLAGCFRPPFKGLAFLIWGYFVACFMWHPTTPILSGHFYDSDDYTYLTQVIDFLKGQSWFDTVQHRMNPPSGVPMHYSRLAELPLMGLIGLGHLLRLDWVTAATIAAALWPLVLFAFFLRALRWVAASYLPADWTRVTAFPALFCLGLLFQFSPGRVDHHGLAALLVFMAYGAGLRCLLRPDNVKMAAWAGFLLALGQAVALETLPYLLLIAGFFGLWLLFKGREMALSTATFGLVLLLSSLFFLIVTKAEKDWLTFDLLAFSATYVEGAAGIALCCTLTAFAALARPAWVRTLVGFAVLAFVGVSFFTQFPDLVHGPYGGANADFANLFLSNIAEARPYILKFGSDGVGPYLKLLAGLLGLGCCLYLMLRAQNDNDILPWIYTLFFLLCSLFISLFYQTRYMYYTTLFCLIPMAVFLRLGTRWADAHYRGHKLSALQFLILLTAGPLLPVLLPAVADGRSFNKGVLLFAADLAPDQTCWDTPFYQWLNLSAFNNGKPALFMNDLNRGAEILFRTPHQVVAGPYHTNAAGIMDSIRFFASTDEPESEKIARDRGVTHVALCRTLAALYKHDFRKPPEDDSVTTFIAGPDDKLVPQASAVPPTLAVRLVNGDAPFWLRPIGIPLSKNILLFEVLPPDAVPSVSNAGAPSAEAAPAETPPRTEAPPTGESAFGQETNAETLAAKTATAASDEEPQPPEPKSAKPVNATRAPEASDGIKIP